MVYTKKTTNSIDNQIEISSDNLFQNLQQGILIDNNNESKTMLIAFGGMKGIIGVPVFEFFKLTSRYSIKKVFLRDYDQVWYQNGIVGVGNDIDTITNYLKAHIKEQNVDKVVTVGNSAGGFASLLFGWLLEVDCALAFSPQTFISLYQCVLNLDYRWNFNLAKMYTSTSYKRKYLDLRKLFQTSPSRTYFHIHYCDNDFLDTRHANHMKGIPNVNLYSYPEGRHELIKLLRDNDILRKLLIQALTNNY